MVSLRKVIRCEMQPKAGRGLCDGKPVSAVWPSRGKGGIAMVGMRPVIFNGTILQNISAFGDGESIERALEMSRTLGLEDQIHRLPMGYNTALGGNSKFVLDASTRKLIALVRGFVVRPKILVLQDPTHGIDHRARLRLVAHITENLGEMTVVAVTHDDLLIGASEDTLLLQNRKYGIWDADLRAETLEAQQPSIAS